MTRASFRPATRASRERSPHPPAESNRDIRLSTAGPALYRLSYRGLLRSGAPDSNRYDEAGDLACCRFTSAPRGADGGSRTRDPGVALRCVAANTSPAKIETCGEQGSRTPRPGRATRVAD